MPDEPVTQSPPAEAPPVTPPPSGGDAPWHSSIFTPDGAFVEGWQTKLPADYDEHRAMFANYRDLKGVAGALKDSMTAARAKPAGLVIPPADAPPEEQVKYQAELKRLYGVPADASGYKIERPTNLPQGVDWSDEGAAGFAAKAAELGLTPKQAQALVEYDVGRLTGAQEAQTKEREQVQAWERDEMAKRWGDKVNDNLMLAARAAMTENMPGAREMFDPKHPSFVGPDIVDLVTSLARKAGEQNLVPGAAVANMDPATMAHDIVNNPSNPDYAAFRDSSHPNSAAVRARVEEGFKRSTGGK